jgi:hypothetical protein
VAKGAVVSNSASRRRSRAGKGHLVDHRASRPVEYDHSVFLYAFDPIESTVTTCDASLWGSARPRSRACWVVQRPACG